MKIGMVSDIHEDIESLQRGIRILEDKGCEELVCLGDVTGFEPRHYPFIETRDAAACVRLIQKSCKIRIKGNHDLFAIREVPKSRFGFAYAPGWYQLDYADRKAQGQNDVWLYEQDELPTLIGSDEKEIIRGWPEFAQIPVGDRLLLFSHYLHPDLTGSSTVLPPDNELIQTHLQHLEELKSSEQHPIQVISFFGHLHTEGLWQIDGKHNRRIRWGAHTPSHKPVAYGVPSVCRGSNRNGVTIFDTDLDQIRAIKL